MKGLGLEISSYLETDGKREGCRWGALREPWQERLSPHAFPVNNSYVYISTPGAKAFPLLFRQTEGRKT